MKVAQEIDVDNVTIIINSENKLQAQMPANSGSVEIEEVTGITNYNDGWGNRTDAPFGITKGGQQYPITKVGRIAGTNWLVFQADGLIKDEPVTPIQPPVTSTNWYAERICEQTEYSSSGSYTGVTLRGDLPEGITQIIITKDDGTEVRFLYDGSTQYKYNVNPDEYPQNGHSAETVTLVTAQGNVSSNVIGAECMYISLPD